MSDTHHPDRPRIHHDTDTMVPRVMVRAMFALVMVILALTTLSVLTKRPLQSTPPPSAIVREVHLHLTSDISGAVTVLDGAANFEQFVVAVLPPPPRLLAGWCARRC